MNILNYYATILRTGLLFCLLKAVCCETECMNTIRGELYQCDNGCCGSSPDQYCCAPSSYIAYLIVAGVLVSLLVVVLIVALYKKKTVSRRRTRPDDGVMVRMSEDRRPDRADLHVPRACIDGSVRTHLNYYHLQWIYGQPIAPPPYLSESVSVNGTHAPSTINGHTSGQIMEWQQHRNTSSRLNVPNSPPPPYRYYDNTVSNV